MSPAPPAKDPAPPATDSEPVPAATDHPHRPTRGPVRRMVTAIILAAALGTLVATALVDPQASPSLTLAAGTAGGSVRISVSPSAAALTFPNMAPGDAAFASLVVRNTGSRTLRYAVTSSTTEDVLARRLRLRIKSGVPRCTPRGFRTAGTLLYRGILGDGRRHRLIGSPGLGAHQGDRILAPGSQESLCAVVRLPLRTSNAFQGRAETTATFSFVAEEAPPA